MEKFMNILFLGDIFGKQGISIVSEYLPILRRQLDLDIVIANAENANDNGKGLSEVYYHQLLSMGIDIITLGNNAVEDISIVPHLIRENNIIKPANYQDMPGKGVTKVKYLNKTLVVINLATSMYMRECADPFLTIDQILQEHNLGSNEIAGIFVDLHGQSAFEKMTIANYVDGRVSAIIGTHTHIPTADAVILCKGTGYQSDAGMCGVYTSCVGIDTEASIKLFLGNKNDLRLRHQSAIGSPSLCGVLVKIDPITKLTSSIAPLIMGGALKPKLPELIGCWSKPKILVSVFGTIKNKLDAVILSSKFL